MILHLVGQLKMLLNVRSIIVVPRRFVQALYVSKSKALGNVRALIPTLDYEYYLKNRCEFEENIRRRGLIDQINIVKIYDQWERHKEAESRKVSIHKRLTKLLKSIDKINSEKTENQSSIEKLIQEVRGLRQELKCVTKQFDEIDEEFNNKFLELPNKLLPMTPDEPQIIFSHGQNSAKTNNVHHLSYQHMIEYINETCYYLQNEAAEFDRILTTNTLKYFQSQGFQQLSNPDFAKTIIVEIAGVPLHNLYEIEQNFDERCTNLLHLVGTGSPLSILGCIAKARVEKEHMPVQFVFTGKMYQPTNKNDHGLFDVVQSTAIQVFMAGSDTQMAEKFEITEKLLIQMFESIDIHFRVIHLPANQLKSAECFATQIQMYSPSLQKYIEIGRLSYYDEFISKRLRFNCGGTITTQFYKPHIIGGTICNITKCLGIALETYSGCIPKTILQKNFIE